MKKRETKAAVKKQVQEKKDEKLHAAPIKSSQSDKSA